MFKHNTHPIPKVTRFDNILGFGRNITYYYQVYVNNASGSDIPFVGWVLLELKSSIDYIVSKKA